MHQIRTLTVSQAMDATDMHFIASPDHTVHLLHKLSLTMCGVQFTIAVELHRLGRADLPSGANATSRSLASSTMLGAEDNAAYERMKLTMARQHAVALHDVREVQDH